MRQAAVPLSDDAGDYDALLDWIGDARPVLPGEVSHHLHEVFPPGLPRQFEAVLHFDDPRDGAAGTNARKGNSETPETFLSGI